MQKSLIKSECLALAKSMGYKGKIKLVPTSLYTIYSLDKWNDENNLFVFFTDLEIPNIHNTYRIVSLSIRPYQKSYDMNNLNVSLKPYEETHVKNVACNYLYTTNDYRMQGKGFLVQKKIKK